MPKPPKRPTTVRPQAKRAPTRTQRGEELVAAAQRVRDRAYAPYSRYQVGAAVLADDGRIYAAANVENASYGLSICAERNAVSAAILAGARRILGCAVVTASSPPAAPCGMCRQTLMEFAPEDPSRVEVTMVNPKGERRVTTLLALLPLAFRPEDLGVSSTDALLLRGGTLITVDAVRRVFTGDLLIDCGRIAALDSSVPAPPGARVLDVSGCAVLPGLVQAHTHVCQTLCRGAADDLPLLSWLKERLWPYEAALDEASMRAATRLAAAELLLSGTTTVLDMGSVHETDAIADELALCGLRATIGKAMMDTGEGVPARLRESTQASLDESDALARRWSGAADDRLRYAYAPRFVLSCTETLLRAVATRLRSGARLHTHASEQLAECELVRSERGDDNIAYFGALGLLGPRSALAHCVHPTASERKLLARSGSHVVHCPSSNLKLGSGIAPIPELLAEGVSVALGADGAPCNNNLDGLLELRLAALLHKHRVGAGALPAPMALELATIGGARAIGRDDELGSLQTGKRADLVVIDLLTPHGVPSPDPSSHIVYAARSSDVRHVFVDGRHLVADGVLTEISGLERAEVIARARREAQRLQARL